MNSSCHGFGETFSASFYKLLSTCPKEERLCCPTSAEKILFLKAFAIFNGLTDSEQNPISFSTYFLARFWKLHSRCPEEHFSEQNLPEKSFFLKFSFRILNKNYLGFARNLFGRFPKKRSTCPEEQSVKSAESKKAMMPKFFGEFSDKSRAFDGKFPADLSILQSTCPETFWGKSIFSIIISIGNFFEHWTQIVKVLAKLSLQVSTNCFLHVERRNACVVQLLRRKFCFWKLLQFSMD